MSSYVVEYQSRGVGAVASRDLGQTAKTSGSLTAAPMQARESRLKPASQALALQQTQVYATPFTPTSPVTTDLGTRTVYGAPSNTLGPALNASFVHGAPSSPFVPGITGIPVRQIPRLVEFGKDHGGYPFLSRPGYGTKDMGLMSGEPPATLVTTPEDDWQEAEALTPNFENDNTVWWILGGLAALWMLTRK